MDEWNIKYKDFSAYTFWTNSFAFTDEFVRNMKIISYDFTIMQKFLYALYILYNIKMDIKFSDSELIW